MHVPAHFQNRLPMSDEQLAKQRLIDQQNGSAERNQRRLKRKRRRISSISRRKNR